MQHVISQESTSDLQTTKLTRALLACGVVAGPLFTVVGLTQAFTRPGFDLTRHALSLLENGDLGWIQISSFLLTGLLFIACAVGMGQVLRGTYSGGTGVLFFVALAGLSTGHLWMTSAFVFTTLNALVWVSVTAAKLLIEQRRASS